MLASNDDPGGGGPPHGERGPRLIAQYPGSVYIGDIKICEHINYKSSNRVSPQVERHTHITKNEQIIHKSQIIKRNLHQHQHKHGWNIIFHETWSDWFGLIAMYCGPKLDRTFVKGVFMRLSDTFALPPFPPLPITHPLPDGAVSTRLVVHTLNIYQYLRS